MTAGSDINLQRIKKMKQRLQDGLEPSELIIRDDSHLHAGHAGAKSGKGHFSVMIISDQFSGVSILKRHQMVYDCLGELMQSDIHALSIKASC